MKITLTAGHGPKNSGIKDPGAIGKGGLHEADQNLQIIRLVEQKFRSLTTGVEIQVLHDGDLWDATESSDWWGADLYVSAHCNSSTDSTAHGIETYVIKAGGQAEKLARVIQGKLVAATGLRDRGVKFANLHELRETNAPAVLIEMGFISNPMEEKLMMTDAWDELVSTAIFEGICEFANIQIKKEEETVASEVIAFWSAKDYSAAIQISERLGNCLITCRNAQPTLHPDAKKAKHLIVVGGPEVTDHPNVTNLCGATGPDTAILAAQYSKKIDGGK